MNFYWHDAAGKLLRAALGCAPDEVAELNVPGALGCYAAEVALDRLGGHYFDGTALVEKPEQPTPNHVFDYDLKQWADPRSLDDLRASKLAEVKSWRDEHLAVFTWDGSVFDSNEARMLGLRVEASTPGFEPVAWRLADNSWRVLTAEDSLAVYAAFIANLRACFQRFGELEIQVMGSNEGELSTIAWEPAPE